MSNNDLLGRPEWQALEAHQEKLADMHMGDLFVTDPQRFEKFHIRTGGILFDYSKNLMTEHTRELLIALGKACEVEKKRDALFSGALVNATERRAALHVALRGSVDPALEIDGENVQAYVEATLDQIKTMSETVRAASAITDVVSIGIGGSNIGPRLVCSAFQNSAGGPRVHFLSNIDGSAIEALLASLQPEGTIVLIGSKTFTTMETMENAGLLKAWLEETLGPDQARQHLYAMTARPDYAERFGVPERHILPLRSWIGGRFSLWSAIGLPIAIALGFDAFHDLLRGAHDADAHFCTAAPAQNIPIMMGLVGIWHRNFWDYRAQAILPYAQNLSQLPVYVQQLDMESNGKSVRTDGQTCRYETGPCVFGEIGTDAQHAFMQNLHQGRDITPADFILCAEPQHAFRNHHIKLAASALAQAQALMEGSENLDEPHRHFPGNRPSNTIVLDRLDPYHLGMLLAFYEHKIFVQGAIWGINSFDQWGVELGKSLAGDLIAAFGGDDDDIQADSSTRALFRFLKNKL